MTRIEFRDIVVYRRAPHRLAPIFKRLPNGELWTRTLDDQLWPLVAKWFYLEAEPEPAEVSEAESLYLGKHGIRTQLPGVIDWTREWMERFRKVLVVPQTDGTKELIWSQDIIPMSDEWRAAVATHTLLQGEEPDLETWLLAYEMAGGERP